MISRPQGTINLTEKGIRLREDERGAPPEIKECIYNYCVSAPYKYCNIHRHMSYKNTIQIVNICGEGRRGQGHIYLRCVCIFHFRTWTIWKNTTFLLRWFACTIWWVTDTGSCPIVKTIATSFIAICPASPWTVPSCAWICAWSETWITDQIIYRLKSVK